MVSGDRIFFTNAEISVVKKYHQTLIYKAIDHLTDNIYIKIANDLFRQCIAIPLGTNCAPLLANLFLYSYEVEFLRSMKKSNKKLAKTLNSASRYTDNLISINNTTFKQFLKDINPKKLVV